MEGRVIIDMANRTIEVSGGAHELCIDIAVGFIEITPTKARALAGPDPEAVRRAGSGPVPVDERAQVLSERPERGKPEVAGRLEEAQKKTQTPEAQDEESLLARWVKAEEARIGKPVVRKELADRLKIHPASVSNYLSGRTAIGQKIAPRFAEAFGVTVQDFWLGPENVQQKETTEEKKEKKPVTRIGQSAEPAVKPMTPADYAAGPGCSGLTETVMGAICQACKDAKENDCAACTLKAARGLAIKVSGGVVTGAILDQVCETCKELDPEKKRECGKCRTWEAMQAQKIVDEGRAVSGAINRVEAARRAIMEEAA